MRELVNEQYAIAVLNKGTDGIPKRFFMSLADLNITQCTLGYKLYDVFESEFLGNVKPETNIEMNINPTGVVMLFVQPASIGLHPV